MLFTTSWDDGYIQDRKLADLLARYGFQGTFYPCPAVQFDQKMMEPVDIKALSERFEIGGHTLTHPRLTTQTSEKAAEEIAGSKQWIEDCTGKPCTMFCYPKGSWNPAVRSLVERAGYKGARTTEMLQFSLTDRFSMPTSLHVYPFPFRKTWTRAKHLIDPLPWLSYHRRRLRELGTPLSAKTSWFNLATFLYRHAMETHQPFFHLWGHSAEIERHGMWKDLERFLIFVKEMDGEVEHVPNSKLVPAVIA